MNRHHPYGGGSFEAPMRRGGPPSGPGPDRPQRFAAQNRGRGFGRGRGAYGGNASFDGNMSNGAYDQGPPTDMAPYSNYEAPPQDPYYQNNNYGAPPPPFAGNGPPSVGYDQGQGFGNNYEGPNFDDGFGRGAGRRPPVVRKDRDDKVHDSIIEERIQRERPCRTLFIRNIKYETNSDDVRRQFEEHGEIKTFFDLISTRGMVFVTYYDLRAAERARDRLQGSEISGRPIDVHYSLPRDDHAKGGDRDKNQQQLQGCLQVTLRSPSGQPIDDNEVRHKFQQFGDVKAVKPVGDRPDSRYVEFYDVRACSDAFDRLRHQGLQDGDMEIMYAWDVNENGPMGQGGGEDGFRGGRGGRGGGRGNRGRGGRGRGYDDDHRGDFGGRDRGSPRGRGRHDDDYGHRGGGGGGRGGPGGGYNNDRFDGTARGGYGGGGYGGPPGHAGPGNYGPPPPAPPPVAQHNTHEDRLEQARKVQALLAALKPPENGGPAAPPPPAPMQMQQPPYYAPPPPAAMPPGPYPPQHQNPNPYASMPPQPPTQPGQPPLNPGLNGIPPHLLALLQSAQQQQQQQSQQGPPPPPPGAYGMPPPQMMNSPPPPPQNGNPQQYQQLLYHLQRQAGQKPQ
ncbi:hypothetical protein B0H17DRAFT_1070163 [Mycena rosella]|uniref:RRM domain-containing protein n=1 Tax=Mycena rosella TaxID=1033263 RepID=A0AAD7DBM3_MYCRO|nr:hypothetical protein B0H17DRAFT_1070163 [Mycena rosella]